ncbi:MAG: toll/interleukin-1 receptor domain-containing protein [Pseudomonadota bacterium]
MKAFLSHSSADKHLVKQVADFLRRARVWFDEMHIETAADLRTALRKGIRETDLFVLFASENSLRSEWVNWEVAIAERQFLAGKIEKIAAFVIDDKVTHKDLPEIFQNTRIDNSRSPKHIASEIQRIIQQNQSATKQALFVGRRREIQEAELALVDYTRSTPPATFNVVSAVPITR